MVLCSTTVPPLRRLRRERTGAGAQASASSSDASPHAPVLARRSLFAAAAAAAALALAPIPALADSRISIPEGGVPSVYWGSGCFWGRQHDFVEAEKRMGRTQPEQITALVGYAGGQTPENGPVCYYGGPEGSLYDTLGHAEVTQTTLSTDPKEAEMMIEEFAKTYFAQFRKTPFGMQRQDPQDMGAGYRSVIGLPGGIRSPYMDIIRRQNVNNMKILQGGSARKDDDKFNALYVYDSDEFPFFQAEAYHQMHDGLGYAFPTEYTVGLKRAQSEQGRVKSVGCPELRSRPFLAAPPAAPSDDEFF